MSRALPVCLLVACSHAAPPAPATPPPRVDAVLSGQAPVPLAPPPAPSARPLTPPAWVPPPGREPRGEVAAVLVGTEGGHVDVTVAIHPSLSLRLRVLAGALALETGGDGPAYRVGGATEIQVWRDETLLQTLTRVSPDTGSSADPLIVPGPLAVRAYPLASRDGGVDAGQLGLDDYNGDGYLDLAVYTGVGQWCEFRQFWLFDAAQGLFVHHVDMSNTGCVTLDKPGQVSVTTRAGDSITVLTFEMHGVQYTLVGRLQTYRTLDANGMPVPAGQVRVREERLVGGKMVVVRDGLERD